MSDPVVNVYAYKQCDACRRALQWLDAQGIAYTVLPIRETPPSVSDLESMLAAYDGQLRRLFNTAGRDYRQLGMKDRLPALSDAEALALLAENGNLVKRPFVIGPGIALVGFNEDAWSEAFGV